MATLKNLANQTVIYGLSSILGRFLNYLLVPLYVYTFPPDQYGIVTEFYAYAVVLQIILTYGMETGFLRFASKSSFPDRVFSTVLLSILSTSTIFFIAVFFNRQYLANLFGYSSHPEYFVYFSIILAVDAVTAIFFARLRLYGKAVKFALFKILNIALNISFNILFIVVLPRLDKTNFFVSYLYNPDVGVGYIFISNLIASLFTFLLFIPELVSLKFRFDKLLYFRLLKYSLPLLITGLAGVVNEMADRILIKWLSPVPDGIENPTKYVLSQLGIYGANAKLAVFMLLFVQAFRYAAEPFFFNHSAKSIKVVKENLSRVMNYYVAFAFLVFLFVMLNLDIFKHILSPAYYQGLNVVFPLFLFRILVGVFFILSFWYKLNDLTHYGVVIFVAGAMLTLILDFIFIPQRGYIAAAWSNFTAYFVMVTISYFWGRKYLRVKYNISRILMYVFVALFIYFIFSNLNFSSISYKLIFSNIAILFYLFFILKVEKIKFAELKSFYGNKSKNN